MMSGKGGVGKSTVSANLAATLASMGHRVGFIDADLYGPNAHILLGLPEEKVYEDLSTKKLVPAKTAHGIEFMSIAQVLPRAVGLNLPAEKVRDIILTMLKFVEWSSEHVIIDCPPGSLDVNLTLLEQLQSKASAIFVMQPHPMALEDLLRIVDVVELYNVQGLCVVVNMANLFPQRERVVDEISKLGLNYIEIPWDPDLTEGVHPEKEYFKRLAEVVAT
ncbi:MAG: hypothetical protein DRO39_06340 [Thermoprotei archaeon]|nr:MAG: hypothetical protein DRO39_06340 [Thermoprotei archaeon]